MNASVFMAVALAAFGIGVLCYRSLVLGALADREQDRLRFSRDVAEERNGRARAGGTEAADSVLARREEAESLTQWAEFGGLR